MRFEFPYSKYQGDAETFLSPKMLRSHTISDYLSVEIYKLYDSIRSRYTVLSVLVF